MSIETVADGISVAKILYKGRDPYLLAKLDWWQKQLGPDKPLLDVRPEDIDEAIRVLMETPVLRYKRNQGVIESRKLREPGTVNKYIAVLATMYKLLRVHRRLPRTFVSPIVKDMFLPVDNARTLQVTLEDVRKLVAAARLSTNQRLPAFVAVACTTGLRKATLQAITWGAVDLRTRTIDVGRTKNGAPVRSVLPVWAAAELNRIRPLNPEPERLVFGHAELKKAFKTAIERANLPAEWTVHSMRHIAASILAQSGASLPTIMQVLGHKSPSMALRYSHLNTKSLDMAITNAWG